MQRTVLIIEDTKEILENVIEILELKEYQVFCASDGKTGVDIAIKEKPDAILCDILMPGMDGYGVLETIKRRPETVDIPFIFMTSQTEKNSLQIASTLGAAGYIIKPFDVENLLSQLESLLHAPTHNDSFIY